MNNSNKQSPERKLIGVMIVCFIGGLVLVAVPALIHFNGDGSLRVSPGVSSVPVATYDSVANLAHWFIFDFMPMIGFCFLVIGYLIWQAYRLVVLAKKKEP